MAGEVGQADVRIDREEGRYFARAVAAAGDENGDGFADILVGSGYYQEDGACAYLFRRPISAGEWSAADADTIVLDEEVVDDCGSSPGSSGGVGDIDGDGSDDLGFSSQVNQDAGLGTGTVYLFRGPLASGSRSAGEADIRVQVRGCF